MFVEVPTVIVVTFICMIIFSAICTACLVIDTYVKIMERIEDRKWGELTEENSTLGNCEETEE